MFCSKCGSALEKGAKYCANCGVKVEEIVDDSQKKSNKALEQLTVNSSVYSASEIPSAKKHGRRRRIGITAVIAAAVCIVAVSVILVTAGGTEKRVAEQLNLAERYLSELDYEQAIAAYEAAIGIDPKCEEAYLGLADVYMEQGNYEEATEILEAALDEIKSEAITEKLEETEELRAESEKAEEALTLADDITVEDMTGEETPEEADTREEASEGETFAVEEASVRVSYAEEMEAIANAAVGDIVYFGSYEQDNDLDNGMEPVEWYVLDKADGEATLLSVYLLDAQPYNEEWVADITWENCTLRSWLNATFYNTAFSVEEQAAIVNTNVANEDNPYFGTEGGNDTTDKVWLLSLGEVERYFHIDLNVLYADYRHGNLDGDDYVAYYYGQDNRVCARSTACVEARGVSVGLNGNGWWWLRSPDEYGDCAVHVHSDGGFGPVSLNVINNDGGVRPALKVAY